MPFMNLSSLEKHVVMMQSRFLCSESVGKVAAKEGERIRRRNPPTLDAFWHYFYTTVGGNKRENKGFVQ